MADEPRSLAVTVALLDYAAIEQKQLNARVDKRLDALDERMDGIGRMLLLTLASVLGSTLTGIVLLLVTRTGP